MSPSSGQSVNSSLPGSLDESPMKSKQNIQADPKVTPRLFFLEVGRVGSWGWYVKGGEGPEIVLCWGSFFLFFWVGDGPYLKVKSFFLFVKKTPPISRVGPMNLDQSRPITARPSLLTFPRMQWGSTDKCSICTRMGRDSWCLGGLSLVLERTRNWGEISITNDVAALSFTSHNGFDMLRSNRKGFKLIPVFSKRWRQEKAGFVLHLFHYEFW